MKIKQVQITGLSKHGYRYVADRVSVGEYVKLQRDPANQYDKKATGVLYDGRQVGWIPKEQNSDIASLLDAGRILQAKIVVHRVKEPIYTSDFVIAIDDITNENPCAEIDVPGFNWPDRIEASRRITVDKNAANAVQQLMYDTTMGLHPFKPLTKEETIMTKIVESNKTAAQVAAYNEGARIALNQITKMVAKQSPLMVKGYLETPFGKLVIANLALAAVQQFRPTDVKLNKLAGAAVSQAYQEVYQTFDIEKIISEFVENSTIKNILDTQGD